MGSLTQKTKRIRKNKRSSQGKPRKRAIRKGSTPRFPVHVEDGSDDVLPQPPGSGSR
jgi:hypothetical protein